MEPILRALPYFEMETSVVFDSTRLTIYAHQIILWVGIAKVGEVTPPADLKFFPAILDTGHNHNFAISPHQLRHWSGIAWQTLPLERGEEKKYQNVPVPHRRANIWVRPNQPGSRDSPDPALPPVLMELDKGIAIYGDKEQVGVKATTNLVGPRLPLVGLRAITVNRTKLEVDSVKLSVWLHRIPKAKVESKQTSALPTSSPP
jgi:hypothetical protein